MGQPADGSGLLGPEAAVLRLLGLWRPHGGAGQRQLAPLVVAAATIASVAFIPAGVALRLCGDFPDQIEETAHCSYIFIVCFGCIVKAVLFIVEGGTVRELVHLLQAMRAEYGTDEGSEAIRSSYRATVDRMYRCFQVMALLPTLYWICSPLAPDPSDAAQTAPRPLPLPFWLSSGVAAAPAYHLLYAVQAVSLSLTVASAVCLDVFFIRLMMMVAAELHVLNENIAAIDNCRATGAICGREEGEFDSLVPSNYPARESTKKSAEDLSDDELFSQLLNNILHHQAILSYLYRCEGTSSSLVNASATRLDCAITITNMNQSRRFPDATTRSEDVPLHQNRCIWLLQTAMNVSIFILLFINMANLCFNVFVTAGLVQDGRDVTKAVKAFSPVPGLLLQTAMYCLFGQITTDQSEKLLHSAFSCGWDDYDTRFKHNLLIFMLMVGRPVEITVGKTYKLSKEMLLQVLNGTYVLLNMLFHVHNENGI